MRGPSADVLRQLFDAAPIAVVAIDVESMLVRYANPAFAAVPDFRAAFAVGSFLVDVMPRAIAERSTAMIEELRRTGVALAHVEVALPATEEGERCYSVAAWPLTGTRTEQRLVVLQLDDISEDVRERALRRAMADQMRLINEQLLLAALREQDLSQRAQVANESKSAFLSMMSHELRTPLTAIIGYEELLSDGIWGPLSDDQRAQLTRIRSSATHLLALIEQVLTLSRLELESESIEWERFSLTQLVRSVSVLIAPLASEKRLDYRVELPPDDVLVQSDALRLKHILANLLGNAVRFTARGEVALRVRQEGGWLIFDVCDTGIGIAERDFERIFDPFSQVEQRHTRQVGGSGLGLTVSRRTARLLGGDIAVASTVGRGSVFTLRVPLSRPSGGDQDRS